MFFEQEAVIYRGISNQITIKIQVPIILTQVTS
jgi:hypothetical protein